MILSADRGNSLTTRSSLLWLCHILTDKLWSSSCSSSLSNLRQDPWGGLIELDNRENLTELSVAQSSFHNVPSMLNDNNRHMHRSAYRSCASMGVCSWLNKDHCWIGCQAIVTQLNRTIAHLSCHKFLHWSHLKWHNFCSLLRRMENLHPAVKVCKTSGMSELVLHHCIIYASSLFAYHTTIFWLSYILFWRAKCIRLHALQMSDMTSSLL